jgi:endonuclease/exonuclease/phosphatase family metal-dependent hydrolase
MPGFLRAGFAALLLASSCLAGCNLEVATAPTPDPAEAQATTGVSAEPAARGEMVRIATFNIQVFGQSKLDKPEVMDVLARTVRRFDVVAIQEVRSSDQNVLPQFVDLINADGSRYDFVIGPRLGRTSSKEQYAFVFDTTRIAIDRQSIYTMADPQDLLHREPLIARFQTLGPTPGAAFTFTLVNIHTDPDETDQELDALDDVFRIAQSQGEDDMILLGDLNVDDRHLGQLGELPGIAWVISGQPTNTRRTKQYDNLVFDSRATVEYTGVAGVFDLQSEFALTTDQALEVSDHLPVWAEFSPYENQPGRALAARPAGQPR